VVLTPHLAETEPAEQLAVLEEEEQQDHEEQDAGDDLERDDRPGHDAARDLVSPPRELVPALLTYSSSSSW
jgi:hypothetical protein